MCLGIQFGDEGVGVGGLDNSTSGVLSGQKNQDLGRSLISF